MLKKITEISPASGLGNPQSKKLLRVESGEHAGRLLAVIPVSADEICYAYADRPYVSWSALETLADDASCLGCDAVMDPVGNVHVVYVEQATSHLVTRKLSYAGGTWSPGDKVYIYNGGIGLAPSLSIDSGGTLWVSWGRLSAGYYDIQVKGSADAGATWGSGPDDIGDTLKTGMAAACPKLIASGGRVYVVYSGTGNDLFVRHKPLSGGTWEDEFTVASAAGIDEQFDAGVSSDGLLGIVLDCGELRYRQYDGVNWSAITTLDESECRHPQIYFSGGVPVVCYLSDPTPSQTVMKYVHRAGGSFSSPEAVEVRAGSFDRVMLFDSQSGSYADVTEAAAGSETGDIVHPSTGTMIKNLGDRIYLGMAEPFRLATCLLSTPGAGGAVAYAYWDGANWKSFTPAGGTYNYDLSEKQLLLWNDFLSIPADWQQTMVDGATMYWLRIDVTAAFAVGPVGSQLNAVSALTAMVVRR
ncbi:MAG: hypothetical protein JSW34_09795 [Candidatus Zixiibacteriota bacterium]|nr:MAG: hypothetical protein JSW34_09795 [candidate division Zixibacteria bacterium]